ncbi:hypothetical protein [Micromonospora craniellae]|uniref:hypothetical protein n=1 Tax=Micromonospora craniellae TaxID=2294034 RepID=UPI001CC82E1D|nr:hypothetical protein [Micromonospora craniellae]
MTARPVPGDLLRIDGRASVQFAGDRALTLRVVSTSDRQAYDGWIWLTGYVIDRHGNATAKREIYVQLAGLRPASVPAPPRQVSRRGEAGGPRGVSARPSRPGTAPR